MALFRYARFEPNRQKNHIIPHLEAVSGSAVKSHLAFFKPHSCWYRYGRPYGKGA